jgi:hypothetical protein
LGFAPQLKRNPLGSKPVATMPDCECHKHQSSVSLYELPQAWVNSLQLLAQTRFAQRRLFRCPQCGQRWQFDPDPKSYLPSSPIRGAPPDNFPCLVIKVPSDIEWAEFDERPARIAHLIDTYGGLTSERCLWRDCTRRALNHFAYCPEHLHDGVP